MSTVQKRWIAAAAAIAMLFGVVPAANAMHIMEGYLPLGYCIAWGAVCIPFLAAGIVSIQRIVEHNRKTLLILAMVGA